MNDLELKKFRDKYNLSQTELADIVGKSVRAVQSWEQGVRNVPQSVILLLDNYERSKNSQVTYSDVKPKTYSTHLEVRVVTIKARGGYADSYYSDEYLKDLPVVLVEADKEYKGKYLAFEVDGDSMEPEYYAGDIVICREVKRDLWQYKLHYKDYDFVIAHGTKGIMLKEITCHNVETGEITCHSLNNENGMHEDFILNLKEVSFLYNIVEHRRSGKAKRRHR